MLWKLLRTLPATGLLLAGACSSAGQGSAGASHAFLPENRRYERPVASSYIKHVVVIIQENRSFENFFAGYPGADAPTYGCAVPFPGAPPAPAVRRGTAAQCPPKDTVIPLRRITFNGPDLKHDWLSAIGSWNHGKMDGFANYATFRKHYPAYSYVIHSLVEPYWVMAQRYVLADHMFPTEFGGSFTGHLTLIAGTDNLSGHKAEVNFPSLAPDDCDAPPGTRSSYLTPNREVHFFKGPFPCFDQFNTMAQLLDGAGVPWKYYATRLLKAGMWEPFEAIKYVRYGLDWGQNIVAPQTNVLADAATGHLARVSWVSPSKPDSDHPEAHSPLGPSWVASVVNAIGEGPDWNSTAIVVVWDDWGGWYDNVPPPQLDYRGLGIRVPCIIISPYSKHGYVSHVQYEYASILRFIEEVNALPFLGEAGDGYTDERASSLDDAFDFTQTPAPFVPIPSQYPMSQFQHEPPSDEPVDTE